MEIGAYESCAPLTLVEDVFDGSSYDFYGQLLTEPGYYTIALEGTDCDSVVGLTLAVTDGMAESIENAIQVWPNPTNGLLNIQAEGVERIEVFNMLGQSVMHLNKVSGSQQIHIENAPKGMYFVRIQSGANAEVKKLIIK